MKEINKEVKRANELTWHDKHKQAMTIGDRIADSVASNMGSWKFIIIQSIFVLLWMIFNVIAFINHWDPYPFILLNLIFSTQAAYAAPIIMMAQNRQNQRDRHQAQNDYETNLKAKLEIESLQKEISRMDDDKLEKIIQLITELKSSKN
jgi:uncharacterized membrane protein